MRRVLLAARKREIVTEGDSEGFCACVEWWLFMILSNLFFWVLFAGSVSVGVWVFRTDFNSLRFATVEAERGSAKTGIVFRFVFFS